MGLTLSSARHDDMNAIVPEAVKVSSSLDARGDTTAQVIDTADGPICSDFDSGPMVVVSLELN